MAHYQIIQTPGNKVVWPRPERLNKKGETLMADPPLRNQDEGKAKVAELRQAAKKQGLRVDFVVQPIQAARTTSPNGTSSQATSIRLSEGVRKELARFVGRVMYETGRQLTMGDAVLYLIAHYQNTSDDFTLPDQLPGEEDIVKS